MIERGKQCDPPIAFSYDGVVSQTTDSHRIIEKAYQLKGEDGQLALVERCVPPSSRSSSRSWGADTSTRTHAGCSRPTSKSRATQARTTSSRATPSRRASSPPRPTPRPSSRPTSSSPRCRRASGRPSCEGSAACRSPSSTTSMASRARRRPRRSSRCLRSSQRVSSRPEVEAHMRVWVVARDGNAASFNDARRRRESRERGVSTLPPLGSCPTALRREGPTDYPSTTAQAASVLFVRCDCPCGSSEGYEAGPLGERGKGRTDRAGDLLMPAARTFAPA